MAPRHLGSRSPTPCASLLSLVLKLFLLAAGLVVASEVAFDGTNLEEPTDHTDTPGLTYEPDFDLFDRTIIGRAPADVMALNNNDPHNLNVVPGTTACYMVENGTIFGQDLDARSAGDVELRDRHQNQRRAPSRLIYISANTCLQPKVKAKDGESSPAPQLSLHVSISKDVQCPNPAKHDESKFEEVNFIEGAVEYALNATGPVYFGISAPNVTTQDGRDWNVAISLDDYYYHYDSQNNSQLLWIDSDSSSVLLVTRNLTQDSVESDEIMKKGPPFEIFITDPNSGATDGVQHSVCGLREALRPNTTEAGVSNRLVTTAMTTRGPGNLPKQQFLLGGLASRSSYAGILVKNPQSNSTKRQSSPGSVGGGGTIYRATTFETLSGELQDL